MKQSILLLLFAFLATLDSSAQCEEVQSSIWKNTWSSCQVSQNPNELHGLSHWILYDLGRSYELSKVQVWNANDPARLGTGFKKVVVDYSRTGRRWDQLGIFDFPQGTGEGSYDGFEGFDMKGERTRYILVTALENWGDESCYGLAEIKFNLSSQETLQEVVTSNEEKESLPFVLSFMPNPAVDQLQVQIQSGESKVVEMGVVNLNGQSILRRTERLIAGENKMRVDVSSWQNGLYFLSLHDQKGNLIEAKRFIVQQ